MLTSKEDFKSIASLVLRALKRDGETKPVRAEMAADFEKSLNRLFEELEQNGKA